MFKEVIFFSAQGDNLQIWNMIRKNIRDKLIVDLKKKKIFKGPRIPLQETISEMHQSLCFKTRTKARRWL